MTAFLDDPEQVIRELLQQDGPMFGVLDAKVCLRDATAVVIEVELAPFRPAAEAGFPTERVRVLATRRKKVWVIPQDADRRRWLHRNANAPTLGGFGDLCLWYRDDDPALAWEWEDGLVDLLTIAHRHLQFEEYWRRFGSWPVEDAPHGTGTFPIKTLSMKNAAEQWSRS